MTILRHLKLKSLTKLSRAMCTKKNIIHVRKEDESDKFQANINFIHGKLNIEKPFNFNRSIDETLECFLNRIKANLGKVFETKLKRKKKTTNTDITVRLVHGSGEIDVNEKCVDVFFKNKYEDMKMFILDSEYLIAINHPYVIHLSMPKCAMSEYPVYPKSFQVFNGDYDNCQFFWKSSKDYGKTWEDVGNNLIHYPSQNEVGKLLKMVCRPGNGQIFGPEVESVIPREIDPGVVLHRPTYPEYSSKKEFRVVSYNILADIYAETELAKTELFAHCPPFALKLDYRRPLLLKEILGYKADIICLQEVDTKVFERDLNFVLKNLNYTGFMAQKQGVSEGVATFFNHNKFRLINEWRHIFGYEIGQNEMFTDLWDKVQTNETLAKRFKERGTALQILVLESLDDPNKYIVIGNTHLYFFPESDNIRLLQAYMSVKLLNSYMKNFEDIGKNVAMVFCGDFNSTPDSGVYEFMMSKFIPSDYKEWHSVKDEAISGLEIKHEFNIKSAYDVTPTFPLTNYTPLFFGCLDYIYFTDKFIKVTEKLELPDVEFLKGQVGLPNPNFPSDHLAICSTFTWL